MSVYTAYEMIADCRAGRPEGWRWFAKNFIPALRVLLEHYGGKETESSLRSFLAAAKRELPLLEPGPMREVLVLMRPGILQAAGYSHRSESAVPLETVADALEPLTVIERQLVWLGTMGYDSVAAARLMRTSPETAGNVHAKANELLRAKLDSWTITLLCDSGDALGEQARSAKPPQPASAHDYLDLIDGRITWQRKSEVERALASSWFEIDHFCRVREADAAAGSNNPLTDEGAAPYYAILGVQPPKVPLWKRVLSRA